MKVPVTWRALTQRIARRLKAQNKLLRAIRSGGASPVFNYVIIDMRSDEIIATDVDLMKLAKEMSVLRAWEELEKGNDLGTELTAARILSWKR